MPRFKARVEVVKALEAAGLFVEKKDNPMQIPICRYVRCADLVAYGLLTNILQQVRRCHRADSQATVVGELQASRGGSDQGQSQA